MISVAVGRPAARDVPAPRNHAKFCGRAQNTLVNCSWSISPLSLAHSGELESFRRLRQFSDTAALVAIECDIPPAACETEFNHLLGTLILSVTVSPSLNKI